MAGAWNGKKQALPAARAGLLTAAFSLVTGRRCLSLKGWWQ